MMVRQNLVEQVRHRNAGVKKFVAVAVASFLETRFQTLASKHVTFTVGREMYQKYSTAKRNLVFETIVSLVSRRDLEFSLTRSRGYEQNRCRERNLLSVGRLDPEKGLVYLVEALHILVKEQGYQAKLHLVGSGQMEENLRTQVSQLGLSQNVCFYGYVAHSEELFDLYSSASLFVLPSLTGEGIPQVLLEAMACKIPTIATNVGGIPYLIQNNVNGLLVEPAQPRQIAEAVISLSQDQSLSERLVQAAFESILDHTLESERDRILTALQKFDLLPQQTCALQPSSC